MRLIDAEWLEDLLLMHEQNARAIEASGRWVKNEDRSGWHCSCCGKDDLYAYPYTENNERELQDFYCPNCGAKMQSTMGQLNQEGEST